MRKGLVIALMMMFGCALHAQSPIGRFCSHVPMHAFYSMAVADDYIYAATSNGLMLLDKSTMNDEEPDCQSWTKVEGLSDIDISRIAYDMQHRLLVVGYDNGNLDFIKNDRLYNLNDVKNKSLAGSKQLAHIRFSEDKIYLVFPFGVVVVDAETMLIDDTWFTKKEGTPYAALDFAVMDGRYYISTDQGIFSLPVQGQNPANFLEWEMESTAGARRFDQLAVLGGRLVANRDGQNSATTSSARQDTLYLLESGVWHPTELVFDDIRSISVNGQEMVVSVWDQVHIYDTSLTRVSGAFWYNAETAYPDVRESVLEDDNIWTADNVFGLVQYNRSFFYTRMFTANGPYSNNTESICCHNGVVAIVPGGYQGTPHAPSYLPALVSWLDHKQWHSNVADFTYYDPTRMAHDFVNIVMNPNDEHECYIASWGTGLYKCRDFRPVALYNAANSILDSTEAGFTFVSGLGYDSQGNLWMTNSQCGQMLKMLEPNGTWHAYNISSGVITASYNGVVAKHLLVDSRGYKWVTFPRDDSFNRYHLIAFYEGGTYDNPGDDKFARVDMNVAAEVTSSMVNCLAEDLDGEIWIGTDKGVKVIYYPGNIFTGNANPRNVLLEQDGYVSVLLEFEEVTAIAVDGANRKWIGTSKAGVFLMSEDGQEQLLHFTAEDHPLFSDQINCIRIDPFSGEVYFSTAKGLISYHGDAIKGYDTYEKELDVYPNPVRHGYTGPVAVRGMKENSLCKITDASGRLVWQGYSFGGQLIWNCTDHFGKRPATGVYYVMASDEEGKEKVVAKFLFIN